MRAVVHQRYGAAEHVLSVGEVDAPRPADNEVLLRVHAASMHPDIWHVVEGVPMALRLFGNGVRRPIRLVPGTDVAGRVEAVGKAVTRLRVGDDVFGETVALGWMNGGSYAEYAVAPADFLVTRPANITAEQASAIPTAGFIAISNLGMTRRFDGQRVLINGAGGCVGMLAIQIVKARGGRVTAVDCAARLDLIRSLGADETIDYRLYDIGRSDQRFDFILDVASTLSHGVYKHLLTPDGVYVPIGHAQYGHARGRMGGRIVGSLPYFVSRLLVSALNPRTRHASEFPTKLQAMTALRELIDAGQLTPVVARRYGLADVATAMKAMEDETIQGRIVIVPA